MFTRKQKTPNTEPATIEVMIDHDGCNWVISGNNLRISARDLDDIDRQLEIVLQPQLAGGKRIDVIMTTNNEIIPEWMRPYMSHYFNRHLELPLRY